MPGDVRVATERKWLGLSLAQQAVWLDSKLSESSPYQLGGWARVEASLDELAVRRSVSLVMARHDALRLRVDDELPRQWLDESVEPPLTVKQLPQGDPDEEFQLHLADLFATPMPLGDSPLFAIEFLPVNENLCFLVWRFHHLIADSTSVFITLSHWREAYESLTGNEQELAPPSSYLQIVASDAAYLDSAAYHKDLAYWSSRFEPLPPPLIADMEFRPKPGAEVPSNTWQLTSEFYETLEKTAEAAGTSAQRALFGLFAVTLGRRYRRDDVVAGVALHRRDLASRHTLGMVAGVIPVRCEFDLFGTLAEAVKKFSDQVDRDLRHQRLPVDVLSRSLGLSGTGRAGLFEVAMSFMPAEHSARAPGSAVSVQTGAVTTKEASPISLHLTEMAGSGVAIQVSVNLDFFAADECDRLAELFKESIHQFVSEAETCVENLNQVTRSERRLILDEWNRTGAEFEQATLDELFGWQVQRTPLAVAVLDRDGQELSYLELDEQSTKLARFLRSQGVISERIVGVRMERSAHTIVAILAILKAGGVYLPLDPAYPEERLQYMVSDAGAMLVLDSISGLEADAELTKVADSSRLAYVIYTSGTTGLPKGVAVPHSAAVNMAFARRACHDPIGVGDRVLASISVGFDVSIGQLLLPLLSGATVVIAPDLKTLDASAFWSLLAERRVTHINSVPSFFDSILDSAPPAEHLHLRRLMLGGEALRGTLVSKIQRVLPGVEVVNMYGPTETCIDASYHIATPGDLEEAVLPIGQPLANYQAYVLDEHLDLVGIGVTGELFVGGAGLARGYVQAAELTAERFIANPFSAIAGNRLYRTGDRARWREDGCLEFLGRVDQQVKIRGFRVEPGEVTAKLLSHPEVAQAAVVARSQANGQVRLVAYLVPGASGFVPQASELRSFVAERLPEYMVPAAFVAISSLPLNRNGKLDERALPSPELQDGGYLAPRTPTERIVAQLFAEVLGLEACGAMDHFFELGGHSLLATSLVSKLQVEGVSVPLRTVFENPTVEALARIIDHSLPPALSARSIAARTRPAQIPLSLPQERIWFVDQLQKDSSYNIPVAFRLIGELNVSAVEKAFQLIVARHEALRTRVVLIDGNPQQEVLPEPTIALNTVLLESEDQLHQRLQQLSAHRFDLAIDYPFQVLLLKLPYDHHVLAAVIHHIAFDGWSAGLFLEEFQRQYTAAASGQQEPLPNLAIQYADFAMWQREQEWEKHLTYWCEELEDAPSRMELPGRKVGVETSRRASTITVAVEPPTYGELLRLARENDASLFMVLHAAFALLLSHWSRQDDVVIGTVVANRTSAELEPLIGCFVNTLPLRTKLVTGESFRRLLVRVKSSDLSAFAHQELPFERLVDALKVERSLEFTPVFQVLLVLQNTPLPTTTIPGLLVKPILIEAEAAKFDLTLILSEQDGGLSGVIEFASDRFDREMMVRFGAQFEGLLRSIARDPNREAVCIDILSPSERDLVVRQWNQTAAAFVTGTLDSLFAQQAMRTPDAVAIIDVDGGEISYAEVEARSTQVAQHLVSQGVGPERVVGVRMARSADTIIAFLAILKAGGTYLPLDPAYPSERLDYMIENAGAMLILDRIPEELNEARLPELDDPERLAYIIYTSGTTGLPKGVAVAHSAAVNMAFARRLCHDSIGPGDRILAAISVGFDVSIGQLLLPLLSGATVVVAGDVKTMAASQFWSFLSERQVSHINSVPSFVNSILDAAPTGCEVKLKRLMLGGEALSGALVSRIRSKLGAVEVVNMYGPTETCIDATYQVVGDADITAAVIPIGRPLSNYQAYVMDQWMTPAPVGVCGELYLGGAGVARGYVGLPSLTAEKFVADPFSTEPGRRLYRTGDLARWREDGCLEFLGRADEQVKIRGFRVEPAEVEVQLRRQAGVLNCAVVTQVVHGTARLVAYFTAETALEVDALRIGMATTLPDYMVPAAFIQLDRLPLTSNGKVDKKALPKTDSGAVGRRSYEPPVGELEEQIAATWAEVLKLERVGRQDSFFELGGHSLLAITLIDRLQRQGVSVDVRTLFTTPTVAGLARVTQTSFVEQTAPANKIEPGCERIIPEMLPLVHLSQEQIDGIVKVAPGGAENVQDIYPLAPLQEGILFQYLITTGGDTYLSPLLLAFDNRPQLDAYLNALNVVVGRHDALRSGMIWKGVDNPVQYVLRKAVVPVEERTLDAVRDAEAQMMALFDPQSYRMDLSQAPLLRISIARDPAKGRWLMLMLTHHLILDHASLDVIVYELSRLMRDPATDLAPAYAYRNFVWQARGGVEQGDYETFFKGMLGDVDEPTAPFGLLDVQSGAGQSSEARLVLDTDLSGRIREQARLLGVTPASVFHLAWAAVLATICAKRDVVFGTLLFGRMAVGKGVEQAVGMLINTLPIRIKIGKSTAAHAVSEAHRLLSELMAHEHASLALAQRCSRVDAPIPLFSCLFNYRYSPESDAQNGWDGVQILRAAERTNYPLAMAVDDSGAAFLLTALAQMAGIPERVCRYLEQALTSITEALEDASLKPLESLLVLPRAEHHLLVEAWNRTDADFGRGTLNDLFSRQAASTAELIAVIDQDGTEISYAELEARSTTLAAYLVENGVKPEGVVGVRMQRSAATVIAFLAILKAGGVYLPLDPSYPADRLEFVISDANAQLVLESIEGLQADADLPRFTDDQRLAYIIYTSGTSGLPKGVAVAHSAAVNLAFARRACHDPIGPGDRILAATSVGFDVSIGQLLLPLLSGATVVIAGDIKGMSASAFWALVSEQKVSHINSVPSFLESILESIPAVSLKLERLMLGGEALSGSLVRRLHAALPGVEVVNMYGPTEACIDATYHVTSEEDFELAVLPIGRPLSNYKTYVLNEALEPASIGVAGELYLGGAGLARGYVRASALTAERFVADPFTHLSGGRLYKTGDRARWRADGRLEFLGRGDQQVKIRGFRVEPGEVESQLRKISGVREAAVIAQTDAGAVRLVAYYTADSALSAGKLRASMAAVLPDYMVPSAFVHLESLPLSVNGKLDRKALPNPDQKAFTAQRFEAPVGEIEERMAALWASLLKVDRVGRGDNFFELGGHSLLAITLIDRMQQQGLPGDVRALFATPTVAGLAASAHASPGLLIPENKIIPGSRKITPEMLPLAELTQSQIDNIVSKMPGGAENIQDIYPLAPLQEGILFQYLMTTQGDPYLAPFLLGFDTRERLDSFLDALQRLVARHDVLRTAMVWQNVPEPLQVVLRKVHIPIDEVQPESLAEYDAAGYRLDLSNAPMLRVIVSRDRDTGRWLLLMLTHHLILDHTSMEIVVAELREFMLHPQLTLPPSPPYRNFVAESLVGGIRERHQEFFTRLLADVDEPTAPFGLTDTQFAVSETRDGDLALGDELTDQIREQAKVLGVTAASLFHLAWAQVLSQISRRNNVVFGTVLFGRMQSSGANRSVGMFINTLPFRLALDETTVAESAICAHALLGELMSHEHAPLALAQRCSSVQSPLPLFSSLFNFRHNASDQAQLEWPGVEMLRTSEKTNYPLAVAVDDSGSRFILRAITQASINPQRICRYLEEAISSVVGSLKHAPERAIQDVRVIPREERLLLLEAWNRTSTDFEKGTLDGLFSKQAQHTPDGIAVIGSDGSEISYKQLDCESNRVARYLVSQGVGRECVVGVRMERSTETIIAFLGILKAGGVYLPLDPAYPAERLEYMISDARATLVLDSVAGLDADVELSQCSDAGRLAYIIYTSGTTGLPKGVAVSHAAPVNMAFARRACHDPMGPGDRVLASISVGFDVSIGQLLLPLLSGATVVVAGELKTLGAGDFWSLLVREQVSHINSVPSFLDSVLDAAPPASELCLKRVMLGGEALSGALVRRIQAALPGVEVVNMYGPTEACIDATYGVANAKDLDLAILPIGVPLSNYQAYVLNHRLEPVPIGAAGEIYLGGAGLARGYVNAPELTAERFVADPFSSVAGSRLYRTGDLARWREDGRIEFLGRVDQQVKIRGFRVEPAEIEARMRQQTGVREAVVITQSSHEYSRLIGYFTGDQSLSADALRARLTSLLPDYMVPSALVHLERLPLTPNGKLDRKALLDVSMKQAERIYTAPRNATETALQEMFQRMLNVDRAGVTDNFFELGGDSLGAMRLMSSINTVFNVNLPMRTLFECPTVEALSVSVGLRESGGTAGNLVPLQISGSKPKLFCVHPAGGHVFCYLPLARALGPDQPVYGLQANGLEDDLDLPGSIHDMAARYLAAVRKVQPEGPLNLLGMSSGGLIAFEMAHQIKAGGGDVGLLALLDTSVPQASAASEFADDDLVRALAAEFGCTDLAKPGLNLRGLIEAGVAGKRLPPDFTLAVAERVARVFRHSVTMHSAYAPKPWDGSMLLLRALRRMRVGDSAPEWAPYITGKLEVVDLDCEHADLVSAGLAATVAELIARHVENRGE